VVAAVAGEQHKAVFLDRDGVIVVPEFRDGRSYAPRRLEDFKFYPEAESALARLKEAGFVLVVVTNQPDVGNGLINQEIIDEMHRRLMARFPITAVKACLHSQKDGCECRKPRPGMLVESARELGIALSESFMVGDRASDIEAGQAAGCRTVFIDLEYSAPKPSNPTYTVRSLAEATKVIIGAPAQ